MNLIAALQSRASEPTATLDAAMPHLTRLEPEAAKLRRNLIHMHSRAAAMGRIRDLATRAVEVHLIRLATGAYPSPDPVPGEPSIVTTATADGSLRLELAGAAERWPMAADFEPSKSLLRWQLPG